MKKLPSIALGTWSWGTGFAGGDQVFGNNLNARDLKQVFDTAMKAGFNLWDTAAAYGMGSSESILGEFVKQYPREDILLSTKFTPQMAGSSKNPVEEMLNGSLERLRTDYIDIYWIHNPTDVNKWTPDLISAVQNHYSLLYRSSEDAGVIDYCKTQNVTFFAYMVLEQGTLSGKYSTRHPLPEGSGRANTYNKVLPKLEELTDAMKVIGDSKNASVAQVAIAWAIAKNTLPIIGVTKTSQIEDALNATKIILSNQEIEKIEALGEKAGVDTQGAWEKSMI